MERTKKIVVDINKSTLDKIKEEVRKRKEAGIYMTQPILLRELIESHFKTNQ